MSTACVPADVRRVVPGDWSVLKALRAEMVQDTPVAFTETLEDVLAKDDDEWRYRAVRGSEGGDLCHLVAVVDGAVVGQAITSTGDDAARWVIGVYLQPAHRGRGLLGRLVDGLAERASSDGADRLLLEVHETNARARAAYRRLGFAETGGRRPYPLGDGDELEMVRPLPAPAIG